MLPSNEDMEYRARQAYYPTSAERLRQEKIWAEILASDKDIPITLLHMEGKLKNVSSIKTEE